MMKTALTLLLATAWVATAQDVLLLKNGDRRPGEIVSADDTTIRLRVPLEGSSVPGAAAATATIGIPRAAVEAIEFKADPARDERLRSATPDRIFEVEIDWKRQEPWLDFPRSQAGAIGCKLGELLLLANDPAKAATALELFSLIEQKSWSDEDKARAKQGRLRAMVATGRVAEAIEQAKQLAAETENPEILIEANYIMARAAELDFNAFLQENPRWEQDPYVIDRHHQLFDHVLELYLYPSLFHGSDDARSARGLWGAVGVYRTSKQLPLAIETARDIRVLHPATTEAKLAEEFLASLKPEELASDFEAKARQALAQSVEESQADPKPQQPQITPPNPIKPNRPPRPERPNRPNKQNK
jgi:hypothetical protein